jgi:hypothetical protein
VGELCLVGSLTGWSHTIVGMLASMRRERIVETQASNVSSVPLRRSSTRSSSLVGGGSVWTSAQQRSKIVRRKSSGTLIVVRLTVQRAETKSTNCKSGIPGFWMSRDCITPSLSTEIWTESITGVRSFELWSVTSTEHHTHGYHCLNGTAPNSGWRM